MEILETSYKIFTMFITVHEFQW